MKHLRLDMYKIAEHPQDAMRRFGITYQHATPQSMSDCWWFWNCENVPDPLPPCLEVLNLAPHKAIGWGLSKAQADSIVAYADQAAAQGPAIQDAQAKPQGPVCMGMDCVCGGSCPVQYKRQGEA